jgi:hypothetical protein
MSTKIPGLPGRRFGIAAVAHPFLPEIVGTQESSGSDGMESTEKESDEEPAI